MNHLNTNKDVIMERSDKIKAAMKLYHKLDDIQKKIEKCTNQNEKKQFLKYFNKNYKLYKALSDELRQEQKED